MLLCQLLRAVRRSSGSRVAAVAPHRRNSSRQDDELGVERSTRRSGPNDGYFFQHLTRHLVSTNCGDEVRRLQLDFRWIAAQLAATGIEALLEDYQHLDGSLNAAGVVSEALRASSHVLSRRPE